MQTVNEFIRYRKLYDLSFYAFYYSLGEFFFQLLIHYYDYKKYSKRVSLPLFCCWNDLVVMWIVLFPLDLLIFKIESEITMSLPGRETMSREKKKF